MRIQARTTFITTRVHKGLSITGLAEAMKVSTSVVHGIEHGRNVRPATAKKACEALNEPFEALFIIKENEENE